MLHAISDGAVPAFYGVRAKDTDGQTLTTATLTAVALDAEDYDTAVFHDNSTNNSRLTVPAGLGGYYQIVGQLVFTADNVGVRLIRLRIDGATSIATAVTAAVNTETTQMNLAAIYPLTATQYVELIGYHTKGSDLTLTAGSFLSMYRVGV